MIVKICGVTRPEDATAAVRAGADWIGINFWPESKRYCDPGAAREVAAAARTAGEVDVVGVFVNQDADHVRAVAEGVGLDRIQLHGDETPEFCGQFAGRCIKAIALRERADVVRLRDYDCEVILVDTPTAGYGGSGRVGDWRLAAAAVEVAPLVLLAGGLTAQNVGDAIRTVRPFGVDVAGGVEVSPGIKDADKMRAFVEAVRDAG